MLSMPVVAIVGRPNVGKSSLLNALVGKRISIVQDMPGVTRDRVSTPLQVDGRYIEIVDTGGYGFVDPDQLTEHIRRQVEIAMTRSNLVLLIVDAQTGLTPADEEIAAFLRRQGTRTILVANKADNAKADLMLGDFARLGLGTPIGISAMNDRNLDLVHKAIRSSLDLSQAPAEIPEPEMLLAIVGKRNAGKSTLVNAIAQLYEGDPERVIVSEVPGTTRDSIDVRFEKEGHTLTVIDTAGVRKKRHMVTNDIEFYSFHRAERSIRRADVVVLLLDGTELVSDPDRKLAQYIAEQFKPVVIVINKWDLTKKTVREIRNIAPDKPLSDTELMDEYREYLAGEFPTLMFAPLAFATAKDGKNIQIILDHAQRLFKQANQRVTTGRLNAAVRQILDERSPSTASGRRARVYYATQIEVAPPTIVLFVNEPAYLDESYQRFVLNRLRELLPFAEVPIRLIVRPRVQGAATPTDHTGKAIEEIDTPRAAKRPQARKPQHRATGKPKPKPAARKGPPRGTRPRKK